MAAFAGAIRSNQAAQGLFDDLDAEIIDDRNGVEALAEMFDLEKAHRSIPYSPGDIILDVPKPLSYGCGIRGSRHEVSSFR